VGGAKKVPGEWSPGTLGRAGLAEREVQRLASMALTNSRKVSKFAP
jgi:hypothetical protein